MKRRLAVIGLGRLGKASGEAIAATEDLAVAGIVRRPESLNQPLPAVLRGARVALHASELGSFDTALICLPTALALEAATDLLQHRIPVVEAAAVPSATYHSYKRELDRVALRHKVAAVIAPAGSWVCFQCSAGFSRCCARRAKPRRGIGLV